MLFQTRSFEKKLQLDPYIETKQRCQTMLPGGCTNSAFIFCRHRQVLTNRTTLHPENGTSFLCDSTFHRCNQGLKSKHYFKFALSASISSANHVGSSSTASRALKITAASESPPKPCSKPPGLAAFCVPNPSGPRTEPTELLVKVGSCRHKMYFSYQGQIIGAPNVSPRQFCA